MIEYKAALHQGRTVAVDPHYRIRAIPRTPARSVGMSLGATAINADTAFNVNNATIGRTMIGLAR